ncbi:hypothetical protein MCJ35_25505 [Enterocloster sp. OA13]|uniref:hypothetical protein n=1 Tax=Enterocloster TaxID=2719313 RepID=UPI00046EB066|nr:hypothetical protein [Lachnoclostridium pacaense]MCC2819378.1 hypothetical protein [Lachnoclostridium pacaense]MCH1952552.1 hypothetical protein [Enterocloster sp. OA13]
MKRTLQKAGILFLIFIAALVIYFVSARNTMEKENTVYTSMEEPSLPVVYTKLNGKEINCLHGYMQDMGNQAARDSISVLPENRELGIKITEYGNTITGISYEVRNLSLDRLIERTDITEWDSSEGITTAVLPIQNLLMRNEPYYLTLNVSTSESQIRYYTRIVWPDNNYAYDMVSLAEEFSRKSLDYEQARELVSYLETNDTEDNSSLGHVTIRASFSHLTWDGLDVEMAGEPQVTLQEFDGIMGQVKVRYTVAITESDNTRTLVDTEDNFTMKWNEKRIYLMNYERNANEMFTGEREAFSGKRILLGITNDNMIKSVKSPKSRYLAFKTGGDLWCYDQTDNELVRIFTFDSSKDDGVRSRYDRHDVKILSVQEDGTVDFLVYGYMNRGKYEGRMGVIYYSYDAEKDTVNEKFYLASSESFEKVREDVNNLSYLSQNSMMYLMLEGSVYGIDLKSNESLVVAQGLTKGSFAVSGDGSRIAWQDGASLYESEKVHVMDFNTAQKQEIAGAEGDFVRVLGFVGNDLIYGFSSSGDKWIVNGRTKGMPMYAMYIVDNEMQVESEYRKDGIYISDVVAEDGRIHLKRLVRLSENQYMYQDQDTIVCNQKVDDGELKGIGYFASQDRGRVYYVQADSDLNGDKVDISAPKAFSYEFSSTLDISYASTAQADTGMVFHAYGGGHYLGSSRSFSTAVDMAYGQMGFVTDGNQHIVWDRINRGPIRNIKSPVEEARKMTKYLESFDGSRMYEEGLILIDAGGCSLNQILYYIDKGIPVIAYVDAGRYVLLSGYDQYNVTLYDPQTQETTKMGLNDATEYFKVLQNDFLCALTVN